MKIQDYKLDLNFDELEADARLKRDTASRELTQITNEIEAETRQLGFDYYNAYHNYIATDTAHLKIFLHFIKCAYDECEREKRFVLPESRRESILTALQDRLSKAFENYYEECEKLDKIEKSLAKELGGNAKLNIKSLSIGVLKLHVFVMCVDSRYSEIANNLEEFRSNEILPLIIDCEKVCIGEDNDQDINDDEPKYLS